MPINLLSKLKKWLTKGKQEYDLSSLENDRTELRKSTSEQSIDSSDGSYKSVDDDVFDSAINIPEKSRSEGALDKLKRHVRNKYKARFSQSDLHTPKQETIRKFNSETEVHKKHKKNRRSKSFVKSFLCAIPEARERDSDTDIKQPYRSTVCIESRQKFNDTSDCRLKSNSSIQWVEEELSSVPTNKRKTKSSTDAIVDESVSASPLCTTPQFRECRDYWEAQGARPKQFPTKQNSETSSGISSMEECLAQQSKDKGVDEYVKSTLQYTRDGHSASCEYGDALVEK